MTDIEMTRLCAEAMGWTPADYDHNKSTLTDGVILKEYFPDGSRYFGPLRNDAQAMALVKKLHLHIDQRFAAQLSVQDPRFEFMVVQQPATDLNRAIVECVAKMQEQRNRD